MKKGTFIVIDGNDGSGKATQAKLLIERLEQDGCNVRTIDFPRYYDNFFGKFIGECLTGEYGDFISVDPHIASVVYAADRFESRDQINAWLDAGDIVIADRYVSANQIHQGSKITDEQKRIAFMEWLDHMEYSAFKLPRPDVVLYLDVPYDVSLKNLQNKKEKYSEGKVELSENDHDYQKNSRACGLWLVEKNNEWKKIDCMDGDTMRTIEDIHEEVYMLIEALL